MRVFIDDFSILQPQQKRHQTPVAVRRQRQEIAGNPSALNSAAFVSSAWAAFVSSA